MTTALTQDVPETFRALFLDSCEQIGCAPVDLLGVMFSESQCIAHAMNEGPAGTEPEKRYNAVGLIQFMPPTLAGLGFGRSVSPRTRALAFRHLTASEQLPYVVAYYEQWRKTGAPWGSAGRLYQATFVPATLATSHDEADVLVQKGGRLGWCYEANAVFDADGNGAITIAELTAAVQRNAKGPRWAELCERLGIALPALPHADAMETVLEVQQALAALGFDPGPTDGVMGPRTRHAISAFQHAHEGLAVDGIAGPKTRERLWRALHEPSEGAGPRR